MEILNKILPEGMKQAAGIPEPLDQAVDVDAFDGTSVQQASIPFTAFIPIHLIRMLMYSVILMGFIDVKHHANIMYAGIAATAILIVGNFVNSGFSMFTILMSAIRAGIAAYIYFKIIPTMQMQSMARAMGFRY